MTAPPEANSEYSRGSGPSRRLIPAPGQVSSEPASPGPDGAGPARAVLAVGALLGAMLVLIAQFTALYHLHSATSSAALKTVGTGGNHAWAPVPLALAAVALAYAVYRHGNRAALVGLVALGVATLLIALFGDLPDAHSSGLIGSSAGGYVQATSSPSAGLYMETLGAVVLIVAGGVGLLTPAPGNQPRVTKEAAA
jgi:hypothetical protein